MRARGAAVTDVAVLVVAADDGVMPQTVEAINHAKAAGVPIVVAVNKVDKEDANPAKVRQQLTEYDLVAEEYGGKTQFVDVSAKTQQNLDTLVETILLVADVELNLKANPDRRAQGSVIEAHLDKGRGPVATILVRRGTLHVGDAVAAGTAFGRVRAMFDENGKEVTAAVPAQPVVVIGLSAPPSAGDEVRAVTDERIARGISQTREARQRQAAIATSRAPRLEDLFARIREGQLQELPLIIKADVMGSVEAIDDALGRIEIPEVRLRVLHKAAGAITEDDVTLAAVAGAIIIGFSVRPTPAARDLANREGVDIRLYSVIYQVVEDIEKALKGLLAPEYEERQTGTAEVRQTFRVPRIGVVAGSYVTSGEIARGARPAWSATAWSSTTGGSARCAASRTTPAPSPPATSAASAWTTSRTSRKATRSRPTRWSRSHDNPTGPDRRLAAGPGATLLPCSSPCSWTSACPTPRRSRTSARSSKAWPPRCASSTARSPRSTTRTCASGPPWRWPRWPARASTPAGCWWRPSARPSARPASSCWPAT